jgi:hypothetical protein
MKEEGEKEESSRIQETIRENEIFFSSLFFSCFAF